MIPVKVEKISYHPSSRSYAVLLKDENSNLVLPILVGSFEAQSMALAIEVITTPRPLTHDLICDMINKVHADLISVNISQLNDIDGIAYNQENHEKFSPIEKLEKIISHNTQNTIDASNPK